MRHLSFLVLLGVGNPLIIGSQEAGPQQHALQVAPLEEPFNALKSSFWDSERVFG